VSASRQDERVAATARSGASLSHVLLYFVLAYAISWAWVIPLAATGHTVAQGRGWPTHLPSLVGPMVAALLVTAWDAGGPGVRDLLARMARWRIGWRWWLAAVSPLLVFLAVLVVLAVAGTDLPAGDNFADFSGISSGLGLLVVWSLILLVNGFWEETGWRGYALAQLQRRWSPVAAAVLVAAGWAVWHIPQFFLLQSYEDFSIPMIPVFLVGLVGGSVVLTWLYNRSGSSILAVAVWHGLYNATGATGAASMMSGLLQAAIWTYVVVLAAVLLVLERRAHTASRPSVIGPRRSGSGGKAGPSHDSRPLSGDLIVTA
jgi:membrane protease YdiL (CAAX protease family)